MVGAVALAAFHVVGTRRTPPGLELEQEQDETDDVDRLLIG